MKFSVAKEKLLEGLQQVQNVVSTRTTLPILSNVLLQTNGSEVRLTTTDLDVGVRGSFEAEVEKEGATTLPARRLFTIIRELPSSEYEVGDRPKIVRYWLMTPSGETAFEPNDETDGIRWVTPDEARRMLSYDRDRDVLAAV